MTQYQIESPVGEYAQRLVKNSTIQSWFGDSEARNSVSGNALLATEKLTFTMSRIPPEKYGAFRDFVNSALRAERERLRVLSGAA